MKKLLGIMIVVALLAPPAMAEDPTVEVKLSIASYAHVQDLPSSVVLTLELGYTTNIVGISGNAVSNVATTLTAVLVEEGSAIGNWDIREISGSVTGSTGPGTTVTAQVAPGVNDFAIAVRVQNVPITTPPQTGTVKQATVTITIAPV